MVKKGFNYEKKMWGINEVDLDPKYLGATRFQYLLQALRKVKKGKVLEIGCGGGAFSRAIKRHRQDLEVVGSDISRMVLELAEERGGGVNYKQADVYKLSFEDNSFDAVVSFDVWEHLEKPAEAFNEVFRVLKPGGAFHFFVPTEGNRCTLYQLLPSSLYKFKQKYTGHVQGYTQEKLKKMLEDAGFVIDRVGYSCFLIYQLLDLLYFLVLKLRGKNVSISVEGYLTQARRSLFSQLLSFARGVFGWITYLENLVWYWLPGGGIHITAIKKGGIMGL